MARFSALVRGTRALKTVSFQIWDQEPKVALRPLNGLDEGDALAGARAYAVGKGVADPKPGDRLFDLGLMAETLFRGCVDTEDPSSPFFSSVGEILEHLDADRIALLWEQHQGWQDECAPRPKGLNGDEFMALVMRAAAEEGDGGADSPFSTLRPVTRASSERTLARLYLNLLRDRSPSGSPDETATSAASSSDTPPATADMPALLDDANAVLAEARAAEPDELEPSA